MTLRLIALFITTSLANAIEFGTAKISDRTVTIIRVDPQHEDLRIFHRDDTGMPIKRLERLAAWRKQKGETLVFAMNAGMYHGNFTPVGLHVEAGQQKYPLNLANGEGNFFLKPNGVFLMTAKNAIILESSELTGLDQPLVHATQSGPLLLRRGQIHPAFNPASKNKLIRNAVGVRTDGIVIFAISEAPVTFHELASLFRDGLKCQDALFLDGTVSSLYAPALKRSDFRMDLGPMFGVTEKPR